MKLQPRLVEKPWGRTGLGAFRIAGGGRLGEVWFGSPGERELPLLVKHIFTSEALSVQVHPDDVQARARGHSSGKNESWYIVDAEPGAAVALGLRGEVPADRLRSAALDGSIVGMLSWKGVRPGDYFHVPAGTIHAIGPGISLIEIQQPSDVTYRLYDHGRPRELHLDEALAVADRRAYRRELMGRLRPGERRVLVPGPHFTLFSAGGGGILDTLCDRDRFVMPLSGSARADRGRAGPGECLFAPAGERLAMSADASLLVAAPGAFGNAENVRSVAPERARAA
ncbi:class I mannose-6-phosphate isomerase [Allosphingosinicella sp.]|uniref:class I mannose-6-phosphate isomerase n=1 Tax=Allosphingosinicella sp. TaxID=2823234 RepID=UPI002F166CED